MSRAFIFDLDGVVADTEGAHYRSWQRLADAEGVPFDRAANERLLGRTRVDSLQLLLGDRTLDPAATATWLARKQAYFREELLRMGPADALPGVRALIEEAHALGVPLGLASSSTNARAVLDRLDLLSRFDVIADGTTVAHPKPAPDIFLWVADALGVAPAQCTVFEDSAAGIAAAAAAGCAIVGLGLDPITGVEATWRPDLRATRVADFLD